MIPLCGTHGACSCPIEARIFACVTYGPHLCVPPCDARKTRDLPRRLRFARSARQVSAAGGQSDKERPAARRPRCGAQDRLVVAARDADPALGAVTPRTA